MKVLIFGAGVIGTIYGQVLSEAGHQVTHYVRPGKAACYADGLMLHLLDGRAETKIERVIYYPIRTVECFSPKDNYDLILVSVRHYQLDTVLPILASNAGATDILFFNALWSDFSPIDRYLPRQQYLWGYPVAGGSLANSILQGALLDEVRLGETDGHKTERLERLTAMFASAHLKTDISDDILGWLWTHFAQEAAVIGVGLKLGNVDRLMSDIAALHEVILCMRETWSICAARGVDMAKYRPELDMFYKPAWLAAVVFKLFFRSHPLERKIMTAHTGEEELKRIYCDVLSEGKRLGVAMPHFAALEPWVEAYGQSLSSLEHFA